MADEPDLVAMTIEVVANYVAHNTIAPDDVPAFISKTHAAIKDLSKGPEPEAPAADAAPAFTPAVTVRKSLASREHIISLIDGKPYKTLKRHLSGHGLTPAEYRERYGLKKDYPLVAPAYSDRRREVAKTLGLGRKVTSVRTTKASASPPPAVETPAVEAPAVDAPAADTPAVTPPAGKTTRKAAAPKTAAKKAAPAAAAKTPVIEAPGAAETPSAAAPAAPKPARKAVSAKSAAAKTAPARKAAPKKAASKESARTSAADAGAIAAPAKPSRGGRAKAPAAPVDA